VFPLGRRDDLGDFVIVSSQDVKSRSRSGTAWAINPICNLYDKSGSQRGRSGRIRGLE